MKPATHLGAVPSDVPSSVNQPATQENEATISGSNQQSVMVASTDMPLPPPAILPPPTSSQQHLGTLPAVDQGTVKQQPLDKADLTGMQSPLVDNVHNPVVHAAVADHEESKARESHGDLLPVASPLLVSNSTASDHQVKGINSLVVAQATSPPVQHHGATDAVQSHPRRSVDRVSPPRTVQSHATTSQAGPGHMTASQAGPGHVTASQAGPGHVTASQAGPGHVTASQAGPGHVTASQAGPGHMTASQAGPGHMTASQKKPSQVSTPRAKPGQVTTSRNVKKKADSVVSPGLPCRPAATTNGPSSTLANDNQRDRLIGNGPKTNLKKTKQQGKHNGKFHSAAASNSSGDNSSGVSRSTSSNYKSGQQQDSLRQFVMDVLVPDSTISTTFTERNTILFNALQSPTGSSDAILDSSCESGTGNTLLEGRTGSVGPASEERASNIVIDTENTVLDYIHDWRAGRVEGRLGNECSLSCGEVNDWPDFSEMGCESVQHKHSSAVGLQEATSSRESHRRTMWMPPVGERYNVSDFSNSNRSN